MNPLGRREKKSRNKQRSSGLRRAGRILYGTIVVLSAIIVTTYAAFTFFVKPPAQADVPEPGGTPPTSASTPAPGTAPTPTPVPLVRQENVYTFLLAAKDVNSGNADTIMVVKYDINAKKVGVVSLLRDTMTEDYPKINAAYHGGVEELKSVVSDLLGIPIDYYITVDIKGFKALVNAVGGVDFYVPCNMNYDDTTPGEELRIHYTEGMHHLNGDQALEVVRFRHNNDGSGYTDIGRTQTQRDLLSAVIKKVFSPSGLLKLDKYIGIFNQYVKTDLGTDDILYFASNAKNVDLKNSVSMTSLPGDGDVKYKGVSWCYQLHGEESLQIVNDQLNPYTTEITMDMVNFIQVR